MAKSTYNPTRNFRSILRYDPSKASEVKSSLPSKTQPNDALTVREIVVRYSQGLLSPDLIRQGVYDPDPTFDSPDLEKLSTMDIHDREIFQQHLQRSIEDAKTRLDVFNAHEAKLKAEREQQAIEDKMFLRKLKRAGKETPRKNGNAEGSKGGSEATDDSND